MVLIVDEKEKSTSVLHAGRIAQSVVIVGGDQVVVLRQHGLHGSKCRAKRIDEMMKDTQPAIALTLLSVFRKRCLKIIRDTWQESFAFGIIASAAMHLGGSATLIHIISDAITATAKRPQQHRRHTLRIDNGTTVVSHLYATSHLSIYRGEVLRIEAHWRIVGRLP